MGASDQRIRWHEVWLLWLLSGWLGGLGGSVEPQPQLRYRRAVLLEQSAAADQRCSWLDGYLARGDALTSQDLAMLVSQSEPLPKAEAVAA